MRQFNEIPDTLFVTESDLPFSIRRARLSDMSALHKACFEDRPLAQFADNFRRSIQEQKAGRRLHLVGLVGNELVANGQLIKFMNLVEISDLAVAPPRRAQGIGTGMISVLEAAARFAGYTIVELSVMAENRRARDLYEKLGFVEDRTLRMGDAATIFVLRKQLNAQ